MIIVDKTSFNFETYKKVQELKKKKQIKGEKPDDLNFDSILKVEMKKLI